MRRVVKGFTLIELLVVVMIVGALATMVVRAVGRGAPAARERSAIDRIAGELTRARVAAMRGGAMGDMPVVLELDGQAGVASLRSFATDEVVDLGGLTPVSTVGEPVAMLAAAFGADGRTDQRAWLFVSEGVNAYRLGQAGYLAADWSDRRRDASTTAGEGRLWRIGFDPVSGAPKPELVWDDRVGLRVQRAVVPERLETEVRGAEVARAGENGKSDDQEESLNAQ